MADDFADFYRSHVQQVQNVLALSGASPQDAADATADAFIRAWERWNRVGSMDHPSAWVAKTAINANRRRHRRRGREVLVESERLEPPPRSDPVPDTDLAAAIRTLSMRQRQVLLLRYGMDLPEAECADVLGIQPGTASATLTQARRRLAELMGPQSQGKSEHEPRGVNR